MAPGAQIDQTDQIDRWWRAANYLSVGQIYLQDNPLLQRPLVISDIKRRLLGHWGTTPGINLVWAHMNRKIVETGTPTMFICGPGHGGPAAIANPWLEGTYGDLYPDCGWSVEGMRHLFRQFSFPGGVPSHAAPETPGSIHEGGELGYALAHAYGAAFDAPAELVVCMVGDGEAETGATAASWHSHRFINPSRDGTVLPVLHLNGYKIANPTIFARMPESQLLEMFRGFGHQPWVVSGSEPADVHQQLAAALDQIIDRIGEIKHHRQSEDSKGAGIDWPMLILRTPKGWTGPESIDGKPVEGHFRSHQVPIDHELGADRLVAELDEWMRSYRIDELFTTEGAPIEQLDALRPNPEIRMSSNPRSNGGNVTRALDLPDVGRYSVPLENPSQRVGSTGALGPYLRDTIDRNGDRFRLFGPDEVASNRLSAVFEATDRVWMLPIRDDDVSLGPEGRVMEILSEHLCQGWLEGYVLTGRHGLFTSYEAFIHVVDSMFNQHAKWIESASKVSWRKPFPSFTYLLSSHVWRQDHNGFSHQDPGFLDVVANKKADVVRIYLPPDANTLLHTIDHCLQGFDLINVVVAGKQPEPQYLDHDEARAHCAAGLGVWEWAGTETASAPVEVVFGCAGDVPTMEAVAAAQLLGETTDLSIRVVNVVDLMTLQSNRTHPHGLPDAEYERLFPTGIPTIFAFHGYPWLVHRFTYNRANHDDLHVHGFLEEGSTTTAFDMAVRNRLDRFHLALAALDRLPLDRQADFLDVRDGLIKRLTEHSNHVLEFGEDLDEISNWTFSR